MEKQSRAESRTNTDYDSSLYPPGWRWRCNAWRYQVPILKRHLWDDKTEFTLGKTTDDAFITWFDRNQGNIRTSTISEGLARYMIEIVPGKAWSTQQNNKTSIKRLLKTFGNQPINPAPSTADVYNHMDIISRKNGKCPANSDYKLFCHSYTCYVRWGLVSLNPYKYQVDKFKIPHRNRYVTDDELSVALNIASPMIKSYIALKLLTGLRRGDLLRLEISDCKPDGIHVTPHKTRHSTSVNLTITWSDELVEAKDNALRVRPTPMSRYVFCTRTGSSYVDGKGKASGFDSKWHRFMRDVWQETGGTLHFQEKDLRKKTATDMPLRLAQQLLGHSREEITKAVYQLRGKTVKPHSLAADSDSSA